MPLRVRLRADLNETRKAMDAERVMLIRTLISAIDNAEAVDMTESEVADGPSEVSRRWLSDEEITNIVLGEGKELRVAAEDYERRGQSAEAMRLRSLALVAERYAEEML